MANLPHFVSVADDGVLEFYLDHTILSSARMCEARFVLDYVENLRPKGAVPWALDFGTLIHHCMEYLYKNYLREDFNLGEWLAMATKLWRDGKFDSRNQLPQFKALGGFEGFIAMLAQYFDYYRANVHYLKPVALEIPFGRNKEVPLLTDPTLYKWAPFRLYLAGRMDYIFDNGKYLGPLDHKTFSQDTKSPILTYEVQEGMTGYVYAMAYIYKKLKQQFDKEHPEKVYERETNLVWMNFLLTKSEPDMNKRFQRIPLYKTEFQLEEWRIRQISSAAKIYQILFEGRPPDYNASVCTNYWHSTCHYHQIHRLGRLEDQLFAIERNFQVAEPWNPEKEK